MSWYMKGQLFHHTEQMVAFQIAWCVSSLKTEQPIPSGTNSCTRANHARRHDDVIPSDNTSA